MNVLIPEVPPDYVFPALRILEESRQSAEFLLADPVVAWSSDEVLFTNTATADVLGLAGHQFHMLF